mmetsp:Transcript_1785/g.4885  ORF Transcript_1785/g.4885 Transcript_1785/m.4885 type:complete len:221 (+) Transcript_1785:1871-2533(+)
MNPSFPSGQRRKKGGISFSEMKQNVTMSRGGIPICPLHSVKGVVSLLKPNAFDFLHLQGGRAQRYQNVVVLQAPLRAPPYSRHHRTVHLRRKGPKCVSARERVEEFAFFHSEAEKVSTYVSHPCGVVLVKHLPLRLRQRTPVKLMVHVPKNRQGNSPSPLQNRRDGVLHVLVPVVTLLGSPVFPAGAVCCRPQTRWAVVAKQKKGVVLRFGQARPHDLRR